MAILRFAQARGVVAALGLFTTCAYAATPDGMLSDSIAERVMAAWGDQPAGIMVHVSDGAVEMWGEAPSESAVSEAVTIARNTVGVHDVVSHLQVGSRSSNPRMQQQADAGSSR